MEDPFARKTRAAMSQPAWTFLSNHGHVLVCIAGDPDLRLRDIAELVGITERAVSRIVGDLSEQGYLSITRQGRRNHYAVCTELPLRHPIEAHHTVGDLVASLSRAGSGEPR